jgi:hypothetical protein
MTENDEQTVKSASRLRGNPDYEQILKSMAELNSVILDELVLSKDPNDVLRAQGATRLMRLIMRDIAP